MTRRATLILAAGVAVVGHAILRFPRLALFRLPANRRRP
jgi:hypothetical protein